MDFLARVFMIRFSFKLYLTEKEPFEKTCSNEERFSSSNHGKGGFGRGDSEVNIEMTSKVMKIYEWLDLLNASQDP